MLQIPQDGPPPQSHIARSVATPTYQPASLRTTSLSIPQDGPLHRATLPGVSSPHLPARLPPPITSAGCVRCTDSFRHPTAIFLAFPAAAFRPVSTSKHSVLFCSILFSFVLLYSILFCSALFYSLLFCSILFCFCSVIPGCPNSHRPFTAQSVLLSVGLQFHLSIDVSVFRLI